MARGVGGFASGLSRGIRTGMEMRRFKREEDEYNFQKGQRDEFQDIMGNVPSSGDLNAVAPVEDVSMDGYAIPAETFTGGQPQMQHGNERILQLEERARRLVDPMARGAALEELNKAQLNAASMSIYAATGTKDPNKKMALLNQAYGYTGAPGDAPFVIGEDGAVTHNIPGLVGEDGSPVPVDMVLSGLVQMVKGEPEKVFEAMTAWREQREAIARQDAEIARDQGNIENQLEIQRERNDLTAISLDQQAATDEALIELRRLGLEIELAKTDADMARASAAAYGLDADALQDSLKVVRQLQGPFLANYTGPGSEVIPNHLNEWSSAAAVAMTINQGRALPEQVLHMATSFMEAKLGVSEDFSLSPVQTPQGPVLVWTDPNSGGQVRVPFNLAAELHRAGALPDEDFQRLRQLFLGGEDPAADPGGPPAEDDIQAPLSYRAGEAVRGALAWDDPRKFHGRAIEGVARGITGAQQGLEGVQNFRRGARGLPLEEEEIGSPSYTGTIQRNR